MKGLIIGMLSKTEKLERVVSELKCSEYDTKDFLIISKNTGNFSDVKAIDSSKSGIFIAKVLGQLGLSIQDIRMYSRRIKNGEGFIAVPIKRGEENEVIDVLLQNSAEQIRRIEIGNGYVSG